MSLEFKICETVFNEITENLEKIQHEHNVVILKAIESGSRAWGFPSPDSDYDVRFIYAHPKDWYLQLSEEKDIIELPINDELDISGWDLRKALNLANKGNAVIQEWINSPIVYKQSVEVEQLSTLINSAFNPISTYHHYRSMAKNSFYNIGQSEKKTLKRFFYFARATLSATWVLQKKTMPSIVFKNLIDDLVEDSTIAENLIELINVKSKEPERSLVEVPSVIYDHMVSTYQTLGETPELDSRSRLVSNSDFRELLNR